MTDVNKERPMEKGWDWAELKAMQLIPSEVSKAEAYRRDVATAMRDADARARAEERAHAAKALKLAHAMLEKAVAAERENSSRERIAAGSDNRPICGARQD